MSAPKTQPLRLLALLLWLAGLGAVVVPAVAPPPALTAGTEREGRARAEPTVPAFAPDDFEVFWEALRIVEERYVDEAALEDENLTRGAIRGLVEALGDGDHTVYLTPEEVQAERDALDGRVTGIGVYVDQRSRLPVIISVIDGSPADRAGLLPDDVIVAVDGTDVERLGLDQVVELVRGEPGSSVHLRVERPGAPVPVEVSVLRDEVSIEPVSWALVPGRDVALVRLVHFSSGSAQELRSAIDEAVRSGAAGVVLDLRGNPGGLVDEAVSMAGAFMEYGVVYQERDRDGGVRSVTVRGEALAPDLPLSVLVDYGTASAAEILAAGLRDSDRARLIGERTYGTGTVLNTFGLSDGSAIRLGVRQWLTPIGEDIFQVGVAPNEDIERPAGARLLGPDDLVALTAAEFAASEDVQLRRAVELLAG